MLIVPVWSMYREKLGEMYVGTRCIVFCNFSESLSLKSHQTKKVCSYSWQFKHFSPSNIGEILPTSKWGRERAAFYNISTSVATKPQGRGHWTQQGRSNQFWKQCDVWKRWVILPGPWKFYLLFSYHRPMLSRSIWIACHENLYTEPTCIKQIKAKRFPSKAGGSSYFRVAFPHAIVRPHPRAPRRGPRALWKNLEDATTEYGRSDRSSADGEYGWALNTTVNLLLDQYAASR